MDKPILGAHREYSMAGLPEEAAGNDPLALFDQWFDAATRSGMPEPNGMTLATVDSLGRPSARVLLLKAYDVRGFVFYTNYESRKAHELENNPHAAMCFWWGALERQVRIEGAVAKITSLESDAYFASRPRASQLGACASPQSRTILSRAELELRLTALSRQFKEGDIPRPPSWGGYRLTPRMIEFWQGREARLHDRIQFVRQADGSWERTRLAP